MPLARTRGVGKSTPHRLVANPAKILLAPQVRGNPILQGDIYAAGHDQLIQHLAQVKYCMELVAGSFQICASTLFAID
jgi:hypothetical protein